MPEWTHLEDMERELYVDNQKVGYEGNFQYGELLRLIDEWAKKYDYHKEVKAHKEKITPHGRNVSMTLEFHRRFTHIHFSFIALELEIENMTDRHVELDGLRTKVNEGEIEAVFFGYLFTHLKGRWETKANVAFVRKLIDKYVYKLERSKYPGTVVSETKDLMYQIKAFLNLYKHRIKELQGHGHGHGGHGQEHEGHAAEGEEAGKESSGKEGHGSASPQETKKSHH